jgi:hypothetical protein
MTWIPWSNNPENPENANDAARRSIFIMFGIIQEDKLMLN